MDLAPGLASRLAAFICGRVPKRQALQTIVLDLGLDRIPEEPRHGDIASALWMADVLSRAELHKWLSGLFAHRKLAAFQSVLSADLGADYQDILSFHRLCLVHHRGEVDAYADQEVVTLFEAARDDPLLKGPIVNAVLRHLVLTENVKALLDILSQLSPEQAKRMTRATWQGVARLLLKRGKKTEAQALLSQHLKEIGPEEKLYFLEVLREIEPSIIGTSFARDLTNWRDVLDALVAMLRDGDPERLAEFQTNLEVPLRSIPPDRDLLDIRLNPAERVRLQSLVVDALRTKRPLSMIRLGDGEAYAFEAPQDISSAPAGIFDQDNKVRELHWWGTHPSEQARAAIRRGVLEATRSADVLGIPSVYRLVRDCAGVAKLGTNRQVRGLMVVLRALGPQVPLDNQVFTEERAHQVILDEPFLKALCGEASSVVVVTCWKEEDIRGQFLESAQFVVIPPHAKLHNDDVGVQEPLFAVYQGIDEAVRRASSPGALVLVGGGLIGKIFVDTARRNGAVALDIGSMLDYLAGRKTRNIADIV